MKILHSLFGEPGQGRKDEAVSAVLEGRAGELGQDTRAIARRGMLLLVLGVGGFLGWALFAPLSQGVPVSGFIKVEGNSKSVQHLRGGIVDEILVREGDLVQLNQPLLRLNETQLKAQFGIVESQLVTALAVEARLQAERAGRPTIDHPEFLLERRERGEVAAVLAGQNQLFRTRLSTLANEEGIARQAIAGLELQFQGHAAQEKARASQLRIFTEEINALRPLHEQGFIPRTRMFEIERAIAFLNGQLSEDIATMGRIRSQISEIQLKIFQSKEIYRKEVETQLTEIQRQVADLKERFVATRDELERVIVRSPATGVVFGLTANTVGGVISPGQKLMDVLPEGMALQIEAQIPTHLIDNVRAGLDADIAFPALDRFEISHIPGRLIYISADRLTDPRTDAAYYLGRVEVTPEGMRALGSHKLQPGMPANVVIVTGERTMFGYLMRPLASRLHFAFTER